MAFGENVQTGDATPVDAALDGVTTSFEHLLKLIDDRGLESYDDIGLIRFMQAFERLRNRLSLVDHRIVTEGDRRALPSAVCQATMGRVLASVLSLSRPEASRRVRAAEAVGPRSTMLGEVLTPLRQHLAAAQHVGEVSAEKVAIIQAAIAKVDRPGFDSTEIDAGERLLTEHAAVFSPEDLRLLATRVADAIDPDGTLPDEELNQDRRHFHLRTTKDGAYTGEFRLTGAAGAKLTALLDSLATPDLTPPAHLTKVGAPAGTEAAAAVGTESGAGGSEPDPRTRGQRMHDAVEDMCDRLLKSGAVPAVGGVATTLLVTIDLTDLLSGLGYGHTADGTLIPTATVLRLANEAEIIPVVLSSTGGVLNVGRSRRIATRTQTLALIARDKGCSFPGCAHPPQYCERHHIVDWARGGKTDLNNLTLVCRYHHHHFASRGWTCQINIDGIPEWTPPRWLKPDRAPMINTRVQSALLTRQQGRQRPQAPPGREIARTETTGPRQPGPQTARTCGAVASDASSARWCGVAFSWRRFRFFNLWPVPLQPHFVDYAFLTTPS